MSGKYNFLPTSINYQFKLVTLKSDHCDTYWFRITLEENVKVPALPMTSEKILVGIDMGLKTTRTVVSVNSENKKIVSIYQPIRTRYYEKSYQSLVWASQKDKRHLKFVHRKIARRRLLTRAFELSAIYL